MALIDLYKMNYDLSNISAMYQYYWKDKEIFTMSKPRPTNAFLYFYDATAVCVTKGGLTINIPCDSILFIPKGLEYTLTLYKNKSSIPKTLLFEFSTSANGKEFQFEDNAIVLSLENHSTYKLFYERMINELSKPYIIPTALKIFAYQLLSSVLSEYSNIHYANTEFKTILKGIEYLENDIKQELSIKEVADMCFVSVNYFERLFKKYSGLTPSQYRIQKKIERSALLLKNYEINLEQISNELNFYDCAHFCRTFKKIMGVSPKEYRNILSLTSAFNDSISPRKP